MEELTKSMTRAFTHTADAIGRQLLDHKAKAKAVDITVRVRCEGGEEVASRTTLDLTEPLEPQLRAHAEIVRLSGV